MLNGEKEKRSYRLLCGTETEVGGREGVSETA
jgi:hypothetical protein